MGKETVMSDFKEERLNAFEKSENLPQSYPKAALKETTIKTAFPKMVIMCGLPNSGKSQIAKIIAQSIHAKILASNEYRAKMFPNPKYSQDESSEVFGRMKKDIGKLLSNGTPVVLDATNLETKNRRTFIKLAKRYGVEIGCIYIESSFEESMEKNSENINKEALLRMSNHIHIPSYCEGLDKIYCVKKINSQFHIFFKFVK